MDWLLKPFEHLFRHRRYIGDHLDFDAFAPKTIGAIAKAHGKSVGRTATIPITQAVTLIERSIRWVLDYSKDLLELKAIADNSYDAGDPSPSNVLNAALKNREWPIFAPGAPFPIVPGERMAGGFANEDILLGNQVGRGGITLANSLAYLCTACSIVIAAFSTRRAAEILGLKQGCIERDNANQPWMRFFIHKTLLADAVIPIPEIVVAATEVLEKLSARARMGSQTPYLLQYNLPGSSTCVGLSSDGRPTFRFPAYLRAFGYFVDVPPLTDGSRWTFKPHQFRRFFAILYIWIYDLGDLPALSELLRHSNLEQTRRYTRDHELGHIISMVDREHTASIMTATVLGGMPVSGTAGIRLNEVAKRMYERMSSAVQPVSERKLHQRILKFVERTGLTIKAFPWGFCAINATSKNELPCAPGEEVPDYLNASASNCDQCVGNCRTATARPYLKESIILHTKISEDVGSPQILRAASADFVSKYKQYLATVE